jgi:hypothetical protein
MRQKYGTFTKEQIRGTKERLRKSIFFLLLCVDPETKNEYTYINIEKTFDNVLYRITGLSSLLNHPIEVVLTMCLLEYARYELSSPYFDFATYRKLILDAGAEIMKIREVD